MSNFNQGLMKRSKTDSDNTDGLSNAPSSGSQASAIISHLSQGFGLLQAETCRLPCKEEATRKLQEVIKLLRGFSLQDGTSRSMNADNAVSDD